MNSAKKFIGIYLIVFIISLVMAILQINIFVLLGINVLIVFFGLILPFLYTILWETNINKLEKFLINREKDPNYQLVYALANNLDDQVEEAISKLSKKYKQKHRQALYKVIYALYKKEILTAKEEIEFIKPVAYMYYYQSLFLMEEGNLNEARQLIEQVSKPWMKSSLLSEMENRLNNPEKERYFAKQALDHAKGLQKYILYKTYEREGASIWHSS